VRFSKTPASNLYGTEYQVVQAAAETSTTSTTVWSNKLTLTTPSLPLGDYQVGVRFKWRMAAANREADFRIQRGGVDLYTWRPSYIRTQGIPQESTGAYVSNISGVNTFTLDFKINGSGTTIFTSSAEMYLIRVT
jgi:hypothetical protein